MHKRLITFAGFGVGLALILKGVYRMFFNKPKYELIEVPEPEKMEIPEGVEFVPAQPVYDKAFFQEQGRKGAEARKAKREAMKAEADGTI